MIEIMVSVVLISIVLIFLMNLFLNMRSIYNQSKLDASFDILVSNIINAVGSDIDEYGLKSAVLSSDKKTVVFTFNTFRETNLHENISKVLKLTTKNKKYYISYGYVECPSSTNKTSGCVLNMTNNERLTNVVREMPTSAIVGTFTRNSVNKFIKIELPISDEKGNLYDINIYGATQ